MPTPRASKRFVLVLLAGCTLAFAPGCAPKYSGGIPASRGPERKPVPEPAAQSPAVPEEPPTPRWSAGRRSFSDTNRDGRIDSEVLSLDGALGTDGYGRWKMDQDFDGFYDLEIEQGGIAGEVRWRQKIHEPVPRVERWMIPGRRSR